ncbi:hypothetical protein POUND7_017370 [Theobroma cacao]
MCFKGSIAPHLGNPSFLVSLDLSSNNFHDYLPKELAKLYCLKLIDLSINALYGEIPLWFRALHKVKLKLNIYPQQQCCHRYNSSKSCQHVKLGDLGLGAQFDSRKNSI